MNLKLFYSYSHQDGEHRRVLDQHLECLRVKHRVETWYDGCVPAGGKLTKTILKNLEQADIILLLISKDFVTSNACKEEANIALQREESGQCAVVPIILDHCVWQDIYKFSANKALPKPDGKPITSYANQNEPMASIASDLLALTEPKIAEDFNKQKQTLLGSLEAIIPQDVFTINWASNNEHELLRHEIASAFINNDLLLRGIARDACNIILSEMDGKTIFALANNNPSRLQEEFYADLYACLRTWVVYAIFYGITSHEPPCKIHQYDLHKRAFAWMQQNVGLFPVNGNEGEQIVANALAAIILRLER